MILQTEKPSLALGLIRLHLNGADIERNTARACTNTSTPTVVFCTPSALGRTRGRPADRPSPSNGVLSAHLRTGPDYEPKSTEARRVCL
jgi:hypothetical protein